MPHQCTNCERVFPDGSKEMLSGCPDCGGNKFQFRPDSGTDAGTGGSDAGPPTSSSDAGPSAPSPDAGPSPSSPDAGPSDPPTDHTTDPPADHTTDPESDAEGASEPASSSPSSTASGSTFIEAESDSSAVDGEDVAQADARRDVVTSNELDRAATPPDTTDDVARAVPPDTDESPDIDDLRQELNDQFESIKILEPGQYELNLMELYDRQECIISLQEDGHYVIEVADAWRDGD